MNAVVVRSTSSARQKSCRTSAAASRSASPRRNYLVFSGLRPEPPKPLPRLCLVPQTRPDFCRAALARLIPPVHLVLARGVDGRAQGGMIGQEPDAAVPPQHRIRRVGSHRLGLL